MATIFCILGLLWLLSFLGMQPLLKVSIGLRFAFIVICVLSFAGGILDYLIKERPSKSDILGRLLMLGLLVIAIWILPLVT